MSLVAAQQFALSKAAPACGVFEQPALLAKGKTAHGCVTSIPVDGRDKFGSEAGFPLPVVRLRAWEKTNACNFFLSTVESYLDAIHKDHFS
jgi:hypothetical protein